MRRVQLRFSAAAACCFVICGLLVGPSFGMVNSTVHPSYDSIPANDPGWNFVGEMSNGTGVYLGDGWVLTPYHVYKHQAESAYIQLDQRYDEVPGTSQRIKHDIQAGIDADLIMFRINGDPQLYSGDSSVPDPVNIRPTGIGNETATIIGTGFGRDGDLQTWDIGGETYEGYNVSDTRQKQWGTNRVLNYPDPVTPGVYGTTDVFYSRFDSGRTGETQPVDKDSGGAAFIRRSGAWELAGVVISMAAVPGYPEDELPLRTHAVYETYAMYADLSVYDDQIMAIRLTPLPGDADWDGQVDLRDFSLLRQTFGQTGFGLPTDFDNSGVVDEGDLDILQRNFGIVSGHGLFGSGGAPLLLPVLAPEPASMLVILGAAPLLLRRRRCKTA